MSTDEKIDKVRRQYLLQCAHEFDAVLNDCESPIEQLFAGALVLRGFRVDTSCMRWKDHPRAFVDEQGLASGYVLTDGVDVFFQQPRVLGVHGRYRADFACWTSEFPVARVLLIELDGYAFHERTKEQAACDKSRDRDLVEAGWALFRFTGSEVYADADACVGQSLRALTRFAPQEAQ